jgi:hypothetical protein
MESPHSEKIGFKIKSTKQQSNQHKTKKKRTNQECVGCRFVSLLYLAGSW